MTSDYAQKQPNTTTDNMGDEEMIDLYNYIKCSECKCCDRHLMFRPESMYAGWVIARIPVQNWKTCPCKCRQNMRMLARKYDNTGAWGNLKIGKCSHDGYGVICDNYVESDKRQKTE